MIKPIEFVMDLQGVSIIDEKCYGIIGVTKKRKCYNEATDYIVTRHYDELSEFRFKATLFLCERCANKYRRKVERFNSDLKNSYEFNYKSLKRKK